MDQHVGRHIFRECIRGLLRGKTIIMSCHQLQYLPLADKVVLIDKQTIYGAGSFAQLHAQTAGGPHEQLFSQYSADTAPADEDDGVFNPRDGAEAAGHGDKNEKGGGGNAPTVPGAGAKAGGPPICSAGSAAAASTSLMSAEERNSGTIGGRPR